MVVGDIGELKMCCYSIQIEQCGRGEAYSDDSWYDEIKVCWGIEGQAYAYRERGEVCVGVIALIRWEP